MAAVWCTWNGDGFNVELFNFIVFRAFSVSELIACAEEV